MTALTSATPPTMRHKIHQNLFFFLSVSQLLVFFASPVFDSKPKLGGNICTTGVVQTVQAKSPAKRRKRYKQTKVCFKLLSEELGKFSLMEKIGTQTRVEKDSNLDGGWGVHSHLSPTELVSVTKTH
jgi:hypothetical protein